MTGRLDKLKAAQSKPELARLLNIPPSSFTYTLYLLDIKKQYSLFEIPKKSGGSRKISAPSKRLKYIQSALSILLLDCLDEINKQQFPYSELSHPRAKHSKILKIKCNSAIVKQPSLSHGFERKRSIITNAMMHTGQKNILNIDLKDFFQSFNFGRVRGFFIKNKNFNLHPNIATTIAQIACFNNELPQGSPCSPVITNLITHSLDIRLAKLAKKHSCIYSRYADDITFSTRKQVFPPQIMQENNGVYTSGKRLQSEIERSGFLINEQKTRILYKDSRQDVTGLVVNKKPSVKKEYWRTVRAQCHSLFNTGEFTEEKRIKGNINKLEGQLNFIDQIDHYNRLRQKPAENPIYQLKRDAPSKGQNTKRTYLFNGREKTFSQFLFYRLFYSNDKTTILTEGKTDNIYLKSAIQILAKSYPTLAKTGPYELLCQFINYTERTRFLLELHGGGSYLKDFIHDYAKKFEKFKAPKPENPVIIFIDNDSGPAPLINSIIGRKYAAIYPSTLDIKQDIRRADFIHIEKNLYLALTPQTPSGGDTDIEYFFKENDRKIMHAGKCFNTVELRNEKNDLSKDSFAKNVIQMHKRTIDFSDFRPLLDKIKMIQDHYSSIKKTLYR